MTRRFGTIGHSSSGAGLAAAMLLLSAISQPVRHKPPTPQQIAAADKRSERQRWNDEVEARKAAKKMAKGAPP